VINKVDSRAKHSIGKTQCRSRWYPRTLKNKIVHSKCCWRSALTFWVVDRRITSWCTVCMGCQSSRSMN